MHKRNRLHEACLVEDMYTSEYGHPYSSKDYIRRCKWMIDSFAADNNVRIIRRYHTTNYYGKLTYRGVVIAAVPRHYAHDTYFIGASYLDDEDFIVKEWNNTIATWKAICHAKRLSGEDITQIIDSLNNDGLQIADFLRSMPRSLEVDITDLLIYLAGKIRKAAIKTQ